MRHPGFMAAFADRVGDIDNLSGFIIIFLVVTVVTALWNDISARTHIRQADTADQQTHVPSKQEFLRQIQDTSQEKI